MTYGPVAQLLYPESCQISPLGEVRENRILSLPQQPREKKVCYAFLAFAVHVAALQLDEACFAKHVVGRAVDDDVVSRDL